MRLLLFFFISILSFQTLASYKTFTPLNGPNAFPPTPYSPNAMKGPVTVDGKFAIAKVNPKSALGLGRQLARANPIASAGIAALGYAYDNGWFGAPEDDSPLDLKGPKVEEHVQCLHYGGTLIGTVKGNEFDSCKSLFVEHFRTTTFNYIEESDTFCEETDAFWDVNEYVIEYKARPYVGSLCNQFKRTSNRYKLGTDTIVKSCPPDAFPNHTMPIDDNNDGEVDSCVEPLEYAKRQPTPVTMEDMATPYAEDELTKWHNESVDALSNWAPYVDGNGNVDPEYIESYNQPDVSTQMDGYMRDVASGNYQTSNPEGANYVPPEMVGPTQVAINATQNGESFVDPTTGQVTNPNNTSEGGTTQPPQTTVTNQNITVQVEIPEDDTISQTEYEESNQKFFTEFDTEAQNQLTGLEQQKSDIEQGEQDFIDSLTEDITNFDVPDFPELKDLFPDLPFGNCVSFTVDTMQGNVIKPMTFDSHCQPYSTYVHPLLYWALFVMTGLYIFHLAGETLGRK